MQKLQFSWVPAAIKRVSKPEKPPIREHQRRLAFDLLNNKGFQSSWDSIRKSISQLEMGDPSKFRINIFYNKFEFRSFCNHFGIIGMEHDVPVFKLGLFSEIYRGFCNNCKSSITECDMIGLSNRPICPWCHGILKSKRHEYVINTHPPIKLSDISRYWKSIKSKRKLSKTVIKKNMGLTWEWANKFNLESQKRRTVKAALANVVEESISSKNPIENNFWDKKRDKILKDCLPSEYQKVWNNFLWSPNSQLSDAERLIFDRLRKSGDLRKIRNKTLAHKNKPSCMFPLKYQNSQSYITLQNQSK